jgi:3-deoxy-manno-octulosonate cytidylyltransferase (CMP-KDO synthetase)
VAPLLAGGGTPMATLKTPFRDAADAASPNAVKVVTDRFGRALYFSRLPIPCLRDGPRDAAANGRSAPPQWYKHLGLYVYQRDFLLNYSNLPRGPLETAEKLEQLRALENGYPIQVVETPFDSVGVDTEEDLARARAQAVED